MPSRRTTKSTGKANQAKPLRRTVRKMKRTNTVDSKGDAYLKSKPLKKAVAGYEKREMKTTSYRKAAKTASKRRLTTRRKSGGLY